MESKKLNNKKETRGRPRKYKNRSERIEQNGFIVDCYCGGKFQYWNRAKHFKTKKHQKCVK